MKFVIYGRVAPKCKWCDEAKSLLTRLGYEFVFYDITKDIEAAARFEARGFMSIPQIYVKTENGGAEGGLIGGYYDLRAWLDSR